MADTWVFTQAGVFGYSWECLDYGVEIKRIKMYMDARYEADDHVCGDSYSYPPIIWDECSQYDDGPKFNAG